MNQSKIRIVHAGLSSLIPTAAAITLTLAPLAANAEIVGESGQSFNLTASEGYVLIADGGSVYSWGYSTDGSMQLPGPTLIVTEDTEVTITLTNQLPAAAGNTSIVFPGQTVTASGGVAGALTDEAVPGGSVTYSFTPSEPGTYQYHSGSQSDLQVEMGLYGALIVRPAAAASTVCAPGPYETAPAWAYEHAGTCFDREYLFLLSEIDIDVHEEAERQKGGIGPIDIGTGEFSSEYWLLNGRAAPDTMAAVGDATLPAQPYNSFPRMHPGERVLLRVVGAGRQLHPFHTHGNHSRTLAHDGRLIVSETDPTKLAGPLLFTIPSVPGSTIDAVFEWTGEDLGWDMFGTGPEYAHTCNGVAVTAATPGTAGFDPDTHEYCPDHGKPIPVTLPSLSSLAFGGFYSGSPYLGVLGSLPPGEGGLNPDAGFTFMWHSHNERELVNNDVFPGGMMTMLVVEAPGVTINE